MMGPVGEVEDQPASLASPQHTPDLEDMAILHARLAQLEHDNTTLRETCAHLQLKLDQVQESSAEEPLDTEKQQVDCSPGEKCGKCDRLSKELFDSKEECQKLRQLQLVLEGQVEALQAQVNECETQEKNMRAQIKALEEITTNADYKLMQDALIADSYTQTTQQDLNSSPNLPVVSEMHQQKPNVDPSDSQVDPQQVLDQCRQKLKDLEMENKTLKEQCKAAEIEKTTLRTNIRKVSANWFERKTRLSDSESDEALYGRQDSGSRKDEGVQVPEQEVLEKFSSLFKKVEDMPKLLAEISFTTGKLDLTERICFELRKRVKDYEKVIDDQEIIIHGLKDQLDTYFNDNQKMSQQLSSFSKLFEDLEITEKTKVNLVSPPDTSSSSFPSLPSEEDFRKMSGSVSRTYIKLKELILEKKSLVTEIERLKVLNVELQRRVTQQETRLTNVSDALHSTWLLVSDMKEQHAQLHSHESILRYELKGKRELLHRLRDELECSREQWHKIRQMNTQSEEAWNSLREELNERRRLARDPMAHDGSGDGNCEEDVEGAMAVVPPSEEFEPPVDLLLDMAIEYGVIDADDDTSTAMVAAMEGQDLRASRLEDLENQCSYLYQKLMASTARSLTLASRLSALHHHFGSSDEEDYDDDDDEDDDDDVDDEYNDDMLENHHNLDLENHHNLDLLETELQSPDTESSDTAYMSEADSGSAASGGPGNLSEEDPAEESLSPSEEPVDVEGDLSKRLINFLPRKIEILHRENRRLEERCELLLHEKLTTEAQLGQALQGERQQRRQLEEKLEHLGKCVDELKLERNGKISEVEEHLKQKVESLSQREQEYESLQAEVERMQEKLDERGNLLHIAAERVKQLEETVKAREVSSQETMAQLHKANDQMRELQSIHEGLNSEYKDLKEEMLSLQQQVADLRFQVSSKDMERHAAVQADLEKLEALKVATSHVSQLEEQISQLEEEVAAEKQDLLSQKDKLTAQVEQLTQTVEEYQSQCKSLNLQLEQTENKLENAQLSLSETEKELTGSKEESRQLTQDNEQLREKIIQLLRRRVRVCDDCFSVQAELAAIVASPSPSTTTTMQQTDKGAKVDLSLTTTSSPVPITSGQPDDDEYAVISDDELQSSRLSSSPSSGSPTSSGYLSETRATLDVLTPAMLAADPPTNSEVWVGAGTRVLVPVDLPAGVSLHWNFISEPKSVSFAVLHQPPADSTSPKEEGAEEGGSPESKQRVLIPTTRVASAQGSTIRGRLLAKQPGVYTLVFDNSCSRFTAKKVTYSLSLKENQETQQGSSIPSDASKSPPAS